MIQLESQFFPASRETAWRQRQVVGEMWSQMPATLIGRFVTSRMESAAPPRGESTTRESACRQYGQRILRTLPTAHHINPS